MARELWLAKWRNWAELPTDCLSVIFWKIGAVQVLMVAQLVCRPWRQLARDPRAWRCIDVTPRIVDACFFKIYASLAREAVRRSNGLVEAFSAEHFVSDEFLKYLADRTNILKSLRLTSCGNISAKVLIEIIKRFPQLEELEISDCQFSQHVTESVCQACPQLKCFRLNKRWYHPHIEGDEDAFAIANNMHELRHLQLYGNKLSNDGLQAILDKCPHLESLDISQCFNITVDGSLRTQFARIKKLRLPDDSLDYESRAEVVSNVEHSTKVSEVVSNVEHSTSVSENSANAVEAEIVSNVENSTGVSEFSLDIPGENSVFDIDDSTCGFNAEIPGEDSFTDDDGYYMFSDSSDDDGNRAISYRGS